MSLIIRKLKYKDGYDSVTLDEANLEKISEIETFEDDGDKFRIASYEPYSRPVDSHRLTYVEKYNGGLDDSPVNIFSNRGGQLVVNKKKLAASLQREWGDGQYTVFKFGGSPSKETFLQNRFIEKIKGSQLNG